jgi:hypothetical protein
VFFPALAFGLSGLWAILPGASQMALIEAVKTWRTPGVMGVITVSLVVLDALFLWLASWMFVRNRLILD